MVYKAFWVCLLYPVNFIKIGPVDLKYQQAKFLTSHNFQNRLCLYTYIMSNFKY